MKCFKTYSALAALALSLSTAVIPTHAENIAIPNFHKVNDQVYRGGQPDAQAWPGLAQMGIKTVIDLRREDEHSSAAEMQAVNAAGMKYVNVPMKGVVAPSDQQISKILSLLNSGEPVFVHCRRGADRTGAVIACYRVTHDGWQRKQALQEAKSFGMGFAEFGLKHYVMSFQPSLLTQAAPLP
jgi:uncharacterized protein (TIGR01244 family)